MAAPASVAEAAPAPPPPPPVAEEPADVKWMRGVLAAAPRESPDEVDLEALFAAALAVPPPPGASNDEAAVRDLLGKLEADNCVMVCEGTVFLV